MSSVTQSSQTLLNSIEMVKRNLPTNLREDGLFCLWKYIPDKDGKKPKKVPYNPLTKRAGDSSDKTTFASFEETIRAFDDSFDGIGMGIFDGNSAIDIDDCFVNGKPDLRAQDIISTMNCYYELSPSETGLHFYYKTHDFGYDKDKYYINKRNRDDPSKGLEVYISDTTSKFITVTGKGFNHCDMVDRTAEVQLILDKYMRGKDSTQASNIESKPVNLSDDEIIQIASNASNGAKFRALWSGDSTGYPSESEADLALCNMLAFYTGRDPERMDRMFRQSGLIRSKWDRRQAGTTYGKITIGKAIKNCTDVYRASQGGESVSDELAQFHVMKDGKPTAVIHNAIFEHIKQTEHVFVLSGIPYIYRGGVYVKDESGAKLKTLIRKCIYPSLIKSTTVKNIFDLFLQDSDIEMSDTKINQYPSHWINFQNGYYDPKEKRMIPHDYRHYAINQIPHEFNPDKCPQGGKMQEWLEFICPNPEDREMLLQYIGLCMTRDTSQEKFLFIVGLGGSGKSTLVNLIELIIGWDNISNIALEELQNRFASWGMAYKLINSCADLKISVFEDTSLLKKILGEDSMRAEPKGKNAFSFRPYARQIFSANELPIICNERTNAVYRRLLILNMSRIPKKQDPNFRSALGKEIDYMIYQSVKALERMYGAGEIFESYNSKKAVKQLRHDSDTVEAFIDDCMIKNDPSGKILQSELSRRYHQYCTDCERAELSRNKFYKALREKGYTHRVLHGQVYFVGLTPRKTTPSEVENDTQWQQASGEIVYFQN